MTTTNERTAEDWGRVAVSLPGWQDVDGMQFLFTSPTAGFPPDKVWRIRLSEDTEHEWEDVKRGSRDGDPCHVIGPDPDDPATAGCLLALLGGEAWRVRYAPEYIKWQVCGTPRSRTTWQSEVWENHGMSLGRACIAAAEALGRWPGGGE